jgi:hypothetical protein
MRAPPRFVRRTLAGAAAAFLAVAPILPARADQPVRVKLPTQTDAMAVGVSIERILNGARGIETRLPGPVADDERVRVAFGTDGSLVAVADDQRLVLHGTGDFEFKVPGPATDVEALPGSESEPGLRIGSVIWQGFCDTSKSLGARLDLIPGQEEVRLPVRMSLAMTVDGRPVEPGHTYTGRLHLRLTVANNSPVPIQVVDGEIGLRRGAAVLDALRAHLTAGTRPVPGEGGVPTSVSLTGTSFRTADLEAPIAIEGSIALPARTVDIDAASGIAGGVPSAGSMLFAATLGGGNPLAHTVDVTGRVRGLRLPSITIEARSGLPSPASLAPPAGATWSAGVRSDPPAFDAREMTALIMDTMWRTARLRQFDAYLGNPDPTGPARSEYGFALAPAKPSVAAAPAPSTGGPLRVLAGVGVAVVLALGAVVVWSRS